MDHYQDMRLLPDPEFPASVLMNALFSKLHRCLTKIGSDDIAISFPEASTALPHLGSVLRLHGSMDAFARLHGERWLHGMRDHLHIYEVLPIPQEVEYRYVRRVQAKSNPERIRRRQMKRHGWSAQEAQERIPDSAARTLSLPYLQVQSSSSGRQFLLFVEHRDAAAHVPGRFNSYGLSHEATVPWF